MAWLIGLSALWGASFLLIRIAAPQLSPPVMTGLRVLLAALTLAVLMAALRERWAWAHWRKMLLVCLLSIVFPFWLFAWAALHIPSGYSALINTSYVFFGCLVGALMGVERLSWRKVLGCLLGALGIGLIVQLGPLQLSPSVLLACGAALLASLCYGFSNPLTKKILSHPTQSIEPLAFAAMTHALAATLMLPWAVAELPQARWSMGAVAATAVLAIITSGLAYWLHLRVMRHISNAMAMSPAFMIPVFGVLWGHVFLGEALSRGLFAGAALALVAVFLISDFGLRQSEQAATP
jgi:drug/metabolite transporter (DMT)-like permease